MRKYHSTLNNSWLNDQFSLNPLLCGKEDERNCLHCTRPSFGGEPSWLCTFWQTFLSFSRQGGYRGIPPKDTHGTPSTGLPFRLPDMNLFQLGPKIARKRSVENRGRRQGGSCGPGGGGQRCRRGYGCEGVQREWRGVGDCVGRADGGGTMRWWSSG